MVGLLAIVFCLLVVGAGFTVLRLLRLPLNIGTVGLASPIGLAALAVVTTWPALFGPSLVASCVLFYAIGISGLAMTLAEIRTAFHKERYALGPGTGTLIVAVGVCVFLVVTGFHRVEVPLWSYDGGHHVEEIDHIRHLRPRVSAWYPPGLHSIIAAFLAPLPWIDSAYGATAATFGLPILAILTTFGLGAAAWQKYEVAGMGALMLAVSFEFPYSPLYWSFWPLTTSIIITLGVWAIVMMYLRDPNLRLALLCAVLTAGIVLVHGTELYSVLLGLILLVLPYVRRLDWLRLARDVGVAGLFVVLLVAPYLLTLINWLQRGGAGEEGVTWAESVAALDRDTLNADLILLVLQGTTAGVLIDAPVRLLLLVMGVWYAGRARLGWSVPAIALLFSALAVLLTYTEIPIIGRLFAATYPWGQRDRLIMLATPAYALVAGAGLLQALALIRRAKARLDSRLYLLPASALQALDIALLLVMLVGVLGYLQLISFRLQVTADRHSTYTDDDARAMAWLRENAHPGDRVANDWMADAGIWVPYKANLPIAVPVLAMGYTADGTAGQAALVLKNIGNISGDDAARDAACSLGVRYVYRGSKGTTDALVKYELLYRQFPPLDELRQSTALEEVFSSGGTSVFRVRLSCFAETSSSSLASAQNNRMSAQP